MSFVITTGSTVTTTTPFSIMVNTDSDPVTTTVTYPAGVSYDSHVASDGTFDGTTWTLSPLAANDPQTLSITVIVDDETAFSAGTRLITATVATLVGEVETGNNVSTRELEGLTCTDFGTCGVQNYFNADLVADDDHTHDGAGFDIAVNDVKNFTHISELLTSSGRDQYSSFALDNDDIVGDISGISPIAYLYAKTNEIQEWETYVALSPEVENEGLILNDGGGRYFYNTPPINSKPNQQVGEYTATFFESSGSGVWMGRTPTKAIYAKPVITIDDTDSPYTVDPSTEEIIIVDNSSGAVTINFPASTSVSPSTTASMATHFLVTNNGTPSWTASHEVIIKVTSDPSVNNVTLEPNGAETIQDIGASATANLVINGAGDVGGSWRIISDDSNLHVI